MRNIKEVRWIESTLWRVGEREHTNLDLSPHQRPKARQAGLSIGLVFVAVVLGRWLLVFAGVVFAVVTFGGGPGLQLLRPRPSTSAQRRRARHLSRSARRARTRAAADAVLSNRERGSGEDCGVAAAIHDHKLRVRLRRVRLHHAPKARVGPLTTTRVPLEILGC